MSLVRFQTSPFSLFDQIFDTTDHQRRSISIPAVNVKESESEFNLELVAPGLKKEDFKLSIDQDTLSIAYQKEEVKSEAPEANKYHRREFRSASFKRAFTLPRNADKDQINASYENGILTLTIPKKEKDDTQKTISVN